jgi:glycosyltransferase involved in cell wall biosynthesis
MNHSSLDNPLLSVLMPVYNGETYLAEAIESILNQTYSNFEFIIINDGSTDESKRTIKSYTDDRIHYVENEKNLGLITCLNNGIELAKGHYILRMDADDFSYPNRFEKQMSFMQMNPDIDISGTWFLKSDRVTKNTNPTTFEACKLNLINNTVLCHPSVILRKISILNADIKFKHSALHAEDYQFWIDAIKAGLKISNLPELLLNYRIHPMQISSAKKDIQKNTVNAVRIDYARFIFGEVIENNKELYTQLIDETALDYASYKEVKKLAFRLLELNLITKNFEQDGLKFLFDKHLKNIVTNIFIKNKKDFYFLSKIVFDKNFYTKTNFKITFNYLISNNLK